jgi:type I restriction enzyme S subunit
MVMMKPGTGLSPDYLAHFLNGPGRVYALGAQVGSAHPHLNLQDIRAMPIPVAPRSEQERVVGAIDEAFSKLNAGEAGLGNVGQLLKRTRDAVLAAAVTGRLVQQDPTDTPAAKILADFGAQPASEALDGLPSTWATVELSEVVSEPLANGRSVRTRAGGFPVLRLTCLRDGRIDLAERKEGEWDAAAAAKFLIKRGDFLVSRGNGSLALVGRGGLVEEEPDSVAYPDTLIRIRVPELVIDASLLTLIWNSRAVRQQLEPQARTTAGIYKVNQGMLSAVRLPLPPREEQRRIVAEVERQLSFIEACKRSIDAGMELSAALRRSVLREAFEGRLVPQDPTDEPASVLLERIQAERAVAPKTNKRRDGNGMMDRHTLQVPSISPVVRAARGGMQA